MSGGTYTLLVELSETATVTVGALGERRLPTGWYAYTGSAFGPGGFSRVDRHYGLAAGDRETRHWHVDYLLGHESARIVGDVRTPGVDVECAVASALPGSPVVGFGASDCDCEAHLGFEEHGDRLRSAVAEAHRQARNG